MKQLLRARTVIGVITLLMVGLNFWVRYPDWWWSKHTPTTGWFTGHASWVDQVDLPLYFRAIRMGMELGQYRIVNVADSTETESAVLYPFYVTVGALGKWISHDPIWLFHGAGLVMSGLLILVAWWFLGIFIKKTAFRLLGLGWLFTAGGIGWLLYPGTILPDIGVPIFTLWNALRSPHEAVTWIGIMGVLGCGYIYVTRTQRIWLLLMGAAMFIVLIGHPQTILILGLLMLSWMGILAKAQKISWQTILWVGVVALIVSGGYYFLIGRELLTSAMATGLRGQDTYVLPLPYWWGGWGLIGLLATYWLVVKAKRRFGTLLERLVAAWVLLQLGLVYVPFIPYRGMMIRGLWVGVVILAVWGTALLARRKRFNVWVLAGIISILSIGDMVFIMSQRMSGSYQPRSKYLTVGEGAAMTYLNEKGTYTQGLIGSYRLANIAIGQTRVRPYAGHYPLTPQFGQRYGEIAAFYQGTMSNETAYAWIRSAQVQWVLFGPEEQQLAGRSTLDYPWLSEVMQRQGTSLYWVR